MLNFRILTTKNTLNSAFFFDAHPHANRGELTKSGVNLLSDYSKTKFHETTKQIGAFFFPKIANFRVKKGTNYRYRREIRKTQWNEQLAIDNVINNDNNVVNIDNIEIQ